MVPVSTRTSSIRAERATRAAAPWLGRTAWSLGSLLALVAVWEVAALLLSSRLFPSPVQVLEALVREIRAMGAGRALAAVAFTAFSRPEDRERALEAGFDAHLGKPLQPHALMSLVAQLVQRGGLPTV